MYYPYLRGRKYELLALREFTESLGKNNNVIPIIEPVKISNSDFKLAIPKMINGGLKFALILNPYNGDFKSSTFSLDGIEQLLTNTNNWIPAFILRNNYIEVAELIESSNYENVMLICTDLTDTTNINFQKLALSESINYIVHKDNRVLKNLASQNKSLIKLDDNFNVQKRNIDYLSMSEEKFSDEHLLYSQNGFAGFSDYTCLSSQFKEGGSAPYAVAIHLTYQKPNKEIWIRHFTSEIDSTSQANIQGKFAEAAGKAITFIEKNGIKTNATEELKEYFEARRYPGLGVAKKMSIKHHIEIINNALK